MTSPVSLPIPDAAAPPAVAIRGKDDWTHVAPKPPLKLPRTQRELFELLAIHDPGDDFAGFLARIDCAGLTPADIHRLAFATAPEDATAALPRSDRDPHAQLADALLSSAFRARLLPAFLAAFPEQRRDVFIHVPKTAGTDLTLNLWPRRVCFPLAIDRVGTNQQALDYCARVARLLPGTDAIFVHGHLELGKYLALAGARPGDRFFATVREPVDLMISQVSDLLGQLLRDPEAAQAQTRIWLRYLELDRVPTGLSPPQLKDLWATALRNPKIAEPNNICRFLSKSGAATYERAMANVVALDVELTTTAQYPRWLADRWGITSRTRHNSSRRMLERDEAVQSFGSAIRGQMAEDEKFFAVVEWALARQGGSAITGAQIAALAGPNLLDGFADELLARPRPPVSVPVSMPVSVPVAVPPAAAPAAAVPAAPRAAPPAPPPPRPAGIAVHDLAGLAAAPGAAGRFGPETEQPAFLMTFGRDGDAARFQETGWANAEQGYTWTNATQSLLHLPRPSQPGTYQLRARLVPFVAAGRLPAQRVAVTVNGAALGEASLGRPSVLECHVGWDVLSRADPVRISFAMPDAARPSEVTGHPNDARLLGLSFQRLWLVGPLPEAAPAPPPRPQPAEPARIEPARIEPARIEPARIETAPAESAPPPAPLPQVPAKIMLRFESLGENCEFGLVQRRSGVDPLGLFRFASAPLPLLLNALQARFAGMGAAEHLMIEVSSNGREYMVFEKRFQFRYHAWVAVHEKTPEEVLDREVRRLPFLVRKLVADLTEGSKIFVFHGMLPITEAAARDLARAVRAYGPATLLWVELADADNPPGSVRALGDGLLKGHMDRFAPGENAHDLSLRCWTELCANALEAGAKE